MHVDVVQNFSQLSKVSFKTASNLSFIEREREGKKEKKKLKLRLVYLGALRFQWDWFYYL
jgi:hypothetical protein